MSPIDHRRRLTFHDLLPPRPQEKNLRHVASKHTNIPNFESIHQLRTSNSIDELHNFYNSSPFDSTIPDSDYPTRDDEAVVFSVEEIKRFIKDVCQLSEHVNLFVARRRSGRTLVSESIMKYRRSSNRDFDFVMLGDEELVLSVEEIKEEVDGFVETCKDLSEHANKSTRGMRRGRDIKKCVSRGRANVATW